MTPKEKAKELIDKFLLEVTGVDMYSYNIDSMNLFSAKQCALIAVDELIENHNKMKDFLFSEIGYLITSPEYWQEVKQEIENN
jgi:hypothetical protein